MKRTALMAVAAALALATVAAAQPGRRRAAVPADRAARPRPMNAHYPSNRAPLAPSAFVPLPLGSVKPEGWLKDQLIVQANGLTGHLDEFWPSLKQSAWRSDKGEAWERGPYYLDGLVPLAYVLDDPRLIEKVKGWMEPILASGQPSGWFGPPQNSDRWPLAVACKVLMQYHEATGDERAIKLIDNYFRYLATHPPDWPDHQWRGVRAMEHLVSAYWLYNRTGDRSLLQVAESIYLNCFDWTSYFLNFPYPTEVLEKGIRYGHPSHVVNLAMAVKYPGIWSQQSRSLYDRKAVYEGLKSLDEHHGQVAGRFAGDEHLSGRKPTQGTELCGVVEFMFSLEHLIAATGDPAFGDRLELLAYNANPGTCTADYWAHQYDQQANQVLVSRAKRNWSTNGDDSNIYGLEPNFGCCTSNMHQGWPKLVSHMWMATPDNGLAAVALGPSVVKAKVADGTEVTIVEETAYPFDGPVRFRVETPSAVKFPLRLRVPGWADGAKLIVAGKERLAVAGTFAVVNREWSSGDTVELVLPMRLRTEGRHNKAVAILRGPLYFSLKIGEKYTKLKAHDENFPSADWQIEPTTDWNYALVLDPKEPGKSIAVETRPVGKVPFANDAAPVTLKVQGRQVPDWKIVDHSAGDTPVSPVATDASATDLELIPYGSTRLRITEFPVAKQ